MQAATYNVYNPQMMRTLTGVIAMNGSIQWQMFGLPLSDECQGVRLQFPLTGRVERRLALSLIERRLQENGILELERRGQVWRLNLDGLRQSVPDFLNGLEWATGTAIVEPEVEVIPDSFGASGEYTSIRFTIYKEEYILDRQQRIFLSHKGSDKPQVRRFYANLKNIGFDPWLDEDAMVAGTELERGILQGFKDSCAAVFFITPNFRDEGYLRTEVNYAIAEKRSKDDRFGIVTIVFLDENGNEGAVPELLKQYVWKEPKTELEAMDEILRALPIVPGEIQWRV